MKLQSVFAGLLTIFASYSGLISAAQTASIHGVLSTAEGKPAKGYLIDIVGTSLSSTARVLLKTDDVGSFEASGLRVGEYIVVPYYEDVSSRYPAGASTFYNPNPVRLQLTAETSANVSLKLPLPNCILTGIVLAAVTASPIRAAITISYPYDSERYIKFATRLDGAYRVLIPPHTKVTLSASAPGFRTRVLQIGGYKENVDPIETITLEQDK